jgi:RHS repeat-associated protein
VDSPRGTTVHVEWEAGGERLVSAGDDVMKECRGYDSRGRLSSVANLPSGSACDTIGAAPYARFEYGYDERGNRTSELYSGQGVVGDPTGYGYDGADRLVGVQYGDGSAALYGLAGDGTRHCEKRMDSYGGPLTANACDPGGATESLVYRYDERGGLKSIVDGANGVQLGQFLTDPAGRLRSETRGTFAREYAWDAGGRLTQLTVSQAVAGQGAAVSTSRYGHDHAGRRVSKADPTGAVTTYLWGGDELVEERLPGGGALRYENAVGMALAVGGERLMHDALGSAVGRIGNGVPTLYRLDAWGSYRGRAPGVGEASAGYAGQHWDVDAGLSYAQQRWYDPGAGRFLSEDPVGTTAERLREPGRLHAFAYGAMNPLRWTDPLGLDVGQAEQLERENQRVPIVQGWNDFYGSTDPAARQRIRDIYKEVWPADTAKELEAWCGSGKDPSACMKLGYGQLASAAFTATIAAPVAIATAPIWGPPAAVVGTATLPWTLPAAVDEGIECFTGRGQTPGRARACINTGTMAVTAVIGGASWARSTWTRMPWSESALSLETSITPSSTAGVSSATFAELMEFAGSLEAEWSPQMARLRVSGPVAMANDAPLAARSAGGEAVSLYRAVGDAELKVIQSSGRIPPSLSGLEVKYFSATPEGAASYARQAVRGFGDAPYTLVETQIPRSSLPADVLLQVDRNVPAVVLPNTHLPLLGPANVWPYMPVP